MGSVWLARNGSTDANSRSRSCSPKRRRRPPRSRASFGRRGCAARSGTRASSRFYDAGRPPELDGAPYLVMERLDGAALDFLSLRQRALRPRLAIDIVAEISRGLDLAHPKGVVHRDLKPANVFLAPPRDRRPRPQGARFRHQQDRCHRRDGTSRSRTRPRPRLAALHEPRADGHRPRARRAERRSRARRTPLGVPHGQGPVLRHVLQQPGGRDQTCGPAAKAARRDALGDARPVSDCRDGVRVSIPRVDSRPPGSSPMPSRPSSLYLVEVECCPRACPPPRCCARSTPRGRRLPPAQALTLEASGPLTRAASRRRARCCGPPAIGPALRAERSAELTLASQRDLSRGAVVLLCLRGVPGAKHARCGTARAGSARSGTTLAAAVVLAAVVAGVAVAVMMRSSVSSPSPRANTPDFAAKRYHRPPPAPAQTTPPGEPEPTGMGGAPWRGRPVPRDYVVRRGPDAVRRCDPRLLIRRGGPAPARRRDPDSVRPSEPCSERKRPRKRSRRPQSQKATAIRTIIWMRRARSISSSRCRSQVIPARQMLRRAVAVVASAGVAASFASPANAADPTTADCLSANDKFISFIASINSATPACSSWSCGSELSCDIRRECLRRVDEINLAMPTIVFEPKDASENELSAVKVTDWMARSLPRSSRVPPSRSIPGSHSFTFESPGQATVTRQLVIHEGEKERREMVRFEAAPVAPGAGARPFAVGFVTSVPARPFVLLAPTDQPGPGPGAQKVVGVALVGVGVVGVALGAVFGLESIREAQRRREVVPRSLSDAGRRHPVERRAIGRQHLHRRLHRRRRRSGRRDRLWLTARSATPRPAPEVGLGPGSVLVRGAW